MQLLTSAKDNLCLLLCVHQEGCARGWGAVEKGRRDSWRWAGFSPGDNTWHCSGHGNPEDQARALAGPGPKGKIFRVSLMWPRRFNSWTGCSAQHSDPWAPAARATAWLMDSLPDVFCSVPRMPFSPWTCEEAYLCWERAAGFSRQSCKEQAAPMQMQSFPVANFSGQVYFSRGRKTGLQTQMLAAASG